MIRSEVNGYIVLYRALGIDVIEEEVEINVIIPEIGYEDTYFISLFDYEHGYYIKDGNAMLHSDWYNVVNNESNVKYTD